MTIGVIDVSKFVQLMNETINKYCKSNWGFDMLFKRYISDKRHLYRYFELTLLRSYFEIYKCIYVSGSIKDRKY